MQLIYLRLGFKENRTANGEDRDKYSISILLVLC